MKLDEIYITLSRQKTKIIEKYGVSGKVISFGSNYNGTFVNLELDSGASLTLNVYDFEMEKKDLESLEPV